MKTLVHVFSIMKENKSLLRTGLCGMISKLYSLNLIDTREYDAMYRYIRHHRPQIGERHYNKHMVNEAYYWPCNKWYPRLLWINAQIKELSKLD